MATTPSYTELVAQIADFALDNSSELAASADDIIALAVRRIETELNTRDGQAEATGSFTIGTPEVSKPANAERNVTLYATITDGDTTTILEKKTPDYLIEMYPDTSYTARPRFYADLSPTEWRVAPTPDAAYDYVFRYRTPLVVPDSSTETPFVVNTHWEVLHAACMAEVGRYKLDPELEAKWEGVYTARLAAANERYWQQYGRDETRVPLIAADNVPA